MILRLFKLIVHLVATAVKLVYRVLKLLRIRLLALWLLASGVMALFGVYARIGAMWFWVGVGVCAAFTVISWVVSAYDVLTRKRVPRERGDEPDGEPAPKPEARPTEAKKPVKYPRWFDVAGRTDYFFAEYADRYELYYRGKNGAEYVRTDYKDEVSND